MCRKTDRTWKKDTFHVSFDNFESLLNYQKTVRAAKKKCFSKIVANNCHRLILYLLWLTLFLILLLLLLLYHCRQVFSNRITDFRSHIVPPVPDSSVWKATFILWLLNQNEFCTHTHFIFTFLNYDIFSSVVISFDYFRRTALWWTAVVLNVLNK